MMQARTVTTMTDRTTNIDRTYGHIDLATGDNAPHITRRFTLNTKLPNFLEVEVPEEWPFQIRIPIAVDKKLDSADWEMVCRKLDTRNGENLSIVEFVLATARIAAVLQPLENWSMRVQHKMCRLVAENLYRVFCEKQIEAGNKAWLVPTSLQETGKFDG